MDAIVIDDSPVEFIIVGPRRGRDRLLVKSQKVKYDLLALGVDQEFGEYQARYNGAMPFSFIPTRRVHSISSRVSTDLEFQSDERLSNFVFAWSGMSSRTASREIADLFDHYLPSIKIAILEGDQEDLRRLLAPIISRCDRSRRVIRHQIIMFAVLMSTYVTAAIIYQFFRGFH